MYDGITMVVPTSMVKEVTFFFVIETRDIIYGLGLKHNQIMKLAEDSTSLLSKWDYQD